MANEEHLAILKLGVDAWNHWRKENPEILVDLSYADLWKTNLCNANLSGASLTDTNLSSADLTRAFLNGAHLDGTCLSGAVLDGAFLNAADLWGVDFSGAILSNSMIGQTSFSQVDLSQIKGIEFILHEFPSTIGVDTLALTLRGSGGRFTEEQLTFFENAGVPATLLEFLPGILETDPLGLFTCFISYSTQDEDFAEPLNKDLNNAGIKTWKWDRDAVRGRDLGENIDRAIRTHDKTILVCSVDSLTSPQVEREIQQALDKEVQIKSANTERRKEALAKGEPPPTVDADVLIPIRLDDAIFNWDSHLRTEVTRRMVADFTDAPPGGDKYNRELQRLVKALNPQAWPPVAVR